MNIFNLKYIFVPINIDNMHWTLAVIDMEKKRIQYYDSYGSTDRAMLEGLLMYLMDEYKAKNGGQVMDVSEWKLVPCTSDTPRQDNGYDCGLFILSYMHAISQGCGLVLEQSNMNKYRIRIAISILNNCYIELPRATKSMMTITSASTVDDTSMGTIGLYQEQLEFYQEQQAIAESMKKEYKTTQSKQTNVHSDLIEEEKLQLAIVESMQEYTTMQSKQTDVIVNATNTNDKFRQRQYPLGLGNLGNTCFMNSILQCLAHTPQLREYYLSEWYKNDINVINERGTQGILSTEFANLIREMLLEDDNASNVPSAIRPIGFKRTFGTYASQFSNNDQHDSGEFCISLIDLLNEDTNCHGYISKLFTGQIRSHLKCQVCEHVSIKLDDVQVHTLPILTNSGPVSLMDCFHKYCEEEILEGSEKWLCSNCNDKVCAQKKISLFHTPPIFVLILKRFYYSSTRQRREKINTFVNFPLDGLNLSKLLQQESGPEQIYDCYAVSNHFEYVEGGHYTTYAKADDGVWREFDDSHVRVINKHDVVSSDAYCLFYRRREVHVSPVNAIVTDSLITHHGNNDDIGSGGDEIINNKEEEEESLDAIEGEITITDQVRALYLKVAD
jgi:ubiquitin C-terminal hydrolase